MMKEDFQSRHGERKVGQRRYSERQKGAALTLSPRDGGMQYPRPSELSVHTQEAQIHGLGWLCEI